MNITEKLRVVEVLPTETRGNDFKIRSCIAESDGQYPQVYKIDFFENQLNLLDGIRGGDLIEFSLNIKGRKYEKDGKKSYFTSLQCWKLNKIEGDQPPQPVASKEGETDDLPF